MLGITGCRDTDILQILRQRHQDVKDAQMLGCCVAMLPKTDIEILGCADTALRHSDT